MRLLKGFKKKYGKCRIIWYCPFPNTMCTKYTECYENSCKSSEKGDKAEMNGNAENLERSKKA